MLINLLFTTAAEDSDEDAEHVTEDELGLGCVLGVGFVSCFFSTSGVPAAKQKTEDQTYIRHLEYLATYLTEVIQFWTNIIH